MAGDLVFITGATGHVGFVVLLETLKAGYAVRASVRKEAQVELLKSHPKVQPYAANLDLVVVPDITIDGAFNGVLGGVTYIEHIASPLPRPTENPGRDIIEPAIRGTTSILNSALKFKSIRRVVITSSAVAIASGTVLSNGDPDNVYSSSSRVNPLPTGPWNDFGAAYRDSKALALDASDRFVAEKSPHFSIVNIMPGYVIGANELVTEAKEIANGSNGVVMTVLMGLKAPAARPANLVGVTDVARIHVAALDETKVVGSKDFVLDSQLLSFDQVADIARKSFSEEVKKGLLPLGGSIPAAVVKFDITETVKTFGPLEAYEKDAISVIDQYLKLSGAK